MNSNFKIKSFYYNAQQKEHGQFISREDIEVIKEEFVTEVEIHRIRHVYYRELNKI